MKEIEFQRWLYGEEGCNLAFASETDGRCVGFQGALRSKLLVHDQLVDAACAVDLFVASQWQMKGLGVSLIGRLLLSQDVVVGLGISGEADETKEHSVTANGKEMSWTGPYHLFHSQVHKENSE